MTTNQARIFGIVAALGVAAVGRAQDATLNNTNTLAKTDGVADSTPAYHPFSISAEAGTTGIGGTARWRFSDHLGLRVGGDYFNYNGNRTYSGINYGGELRLLSEPLTLDIFPWKDRSFCLSLGAALNQNRLTGTANPAPGTSVTIGNTTYTAAEAGTLNLKIEPNLISPYVSIGGNLFYFDSGHHCALAGELGVMYGGNPDVTLTSSTGVVTAADLANETHKIQNDANYTKFWPVLKLAVNISF